MVLSLLRVRELQREIFGNSFIDPLIFIRGPAYQVAQPLVSDFVEWHNIREERPARRAQPGAVLGFVGQERICGEIQQARPSLAETAGNLRDAKSMERERAGVEFIKTDRGIDFTRQLPKERRGAWRKRGHVVSQRDSRDGCVPASIFRGRRS